MLYHEWSLPQLMYSQETAVPRYRSILSKSTALCSLLALGGIPVYGQSCAADFDDSGAIDGADLTVLLSAWGDGDERDLTGDGRVDGSDLTVLLSEWGTCVVESLETLFAPPSEAELQAVRDDWAARNVDAIDWTVVGSGSFQGFAVDVVSHRVDGNLHYGFVRYPAAYSPNGSYPVLVLNHGGQSGVGLGILGQAGQGCLSDYVIVVPCFRGELLRTESLGFGDFLSEGENSEFDGDLDDTIALLNGALEHVSGANEERIHAFGGSRGGCVTHLLSVRDSRFKGGVAFFGATNHMLPEIQESIESYLENGGQLTNPVLSTAYNSAVEPWMSGSLSFADARLALIRRSALFFAESTPMPFHVHHGAVDFIVPIIHSEIFTERMEELGRLEEGYVYWEYPNGGHGNNMSESFGRMQDFFCDLDG